VTIFFTIHFEHAKGTMKNSKKIGFLIAVLASAVFLSGCASGLRTTKSAKLRDNATLLIMPPHDVVQNGQPHEMGKGSGEYLRKAVNEKLAQRTNLKLVSFEPTATINNTTVITKSDALAETRKVKADYVLVLGLGEFMNAAPMTFRPDFATLESGFLFDVASGEEVWSVKSPLMLQKGNIGNHLVLIDKMAASVAQTIAK
jgi:PBP1b-binding outer membrane lipoprotein LpoB